MNPDINTAELHEIHLQERPCDVLEDTALPAVDILAGQVADLTIDGKAAPPCFVP